MTGDKAENYKKPPRTLIDLVDSDDKLVDDDSVAPVECNEEGLHEGDETNDNMQIEVNVSLEESVRLLEEAAAEQAREQWKKMYPKEYAKRQRDEEKKRKAEICRAKKAAQIQARELIKMAKEANRAGKWQACNKVIGIPPVFIFPWQSRAHSIAKVAPKKKQAAVCPSSNEAETSSAIDHRTKKRQAELQREAEQENFRKWAVVNLDPVPNPLPDFHKWARMYPDLNRKKEKSEKLAASIATKKAGARAKIELKEAWEIAKEASKGGPEKKGVPEMQYKLGKIFKTGIHSVPVNNTEAVRWLRKAAESNIVDAASELAHMYHFGLGVEKSIDRAGLWYMKAAEQGNAEAQFRIGELFDEGRGVKQSYDNAAKWYLKAAENGVVEAQYRVASMFMEGRGTKKSVKTGVKWYRKAAFGHHEDAMYQYGNICRSGKGGTKKSDEEAFLWYRRAAKERIDDGTSEHLSHGSLEAQYALAMMYGRGRGVEQSDAQALKWYHVCAEQRHVEAEFALGNMYVNGRGCRQNDSEAVKWYNRASNHGHEEARKRLGLLYKQGRGVKVSSGATPLYIAARQGQFDVVKILLEQGVDIEEGLAYSRTTPLAAAAKGGHTECVKILLDNKAHVGRTTTDCGSNALMFSASYGHAEIMKLLLNTGQVDVNEPRESDFVSPLMLSCYEGHFDTARLLIENGADPNYIREKDGVTALFMASQRGHLEIVKLLLWGAENYITPVIDEEDNHSQHSGGTFSRFPFRRHAPTGPISRRETTSPPIMESTAMSPKSPNSNVGAIPLSPSVLKYGAHVKHDTEAPESISNTPRTPRVDVNVLTKTTNCTALIMAAQNGHLNIAKHLLKAKADVNISKLDEGATALVMACQNNHPEIAQLLINANADKEYKSMYGSALVIATRHKLRHVKELLEYVPPEPEEGDGKGHGMLSGLGMGSFFSGGKKSPSPKTATTSPKALLSPKNTATSADDEAAVTKGKTGIFFP